MHVWNVGQGLAQKQPLHTFQLDHSVWTLSHWQTDAHASGTTTQRVAARRLATGSDNGWLQVYSLES
jgi:hypothetical protein